MDVAQVLCAPLPLADPGPTAVRAGGAQFSELVRRVCARGDDPGGTGGEVVQVADGAGSEPEVGVSGSNIPTGRTLENISLEFAERGRPVAGDPPPEADEDILAAFLAALVRDASPGPSAVPVSSPAQPAPGGETAGTSDECGEGAEDEPAPDPSVPQILVHAAQPVVAAPPEQQQVQQVAPDAAAGGAADVSLSLRLRHRPDDGAGAPATGQVALHAGPPAAAEPVPVAPARPDAAPAPIRSGLPPEPAPLPRADALPRPVQLSPDATTPMPQDMADAVSQLGLGGRRTAYQPFEARQLVVEPSPLQSHRGTLDLALQMAAGPAEGAPGVAAAGDGAGAGAQYSSDREALVSQAMDAIIELHDGASAGQIVVSVEPPELGRLEVTMSSDASGALSISLSASEKRGHDALREGLPDLESLLAERGHQLADLELSYSGGDSRGWRDGRELADELSWLTSSVSARQEPDRAATAAEQTASPSGVVDIVL